MNRKPYFRELTVANGDALIVEAGATAAVFDIGFPPEGELVAFSAQQVVDDPGDNVAAQCELFSADPATVVPELARIVPNSELAVGSGTPLVKQWDGYHYQNREGSWSERVRKIYLKITPADTTNDTVWEVVLGVQQGTT